MLRRNPGTPEGDGRSRLARWRGDLGLRRERLLFGWQAVRGKAARDIVLESGDDGLALNDSERRLALPVPSYARAFRHGVHSRLQATARKYLGASGFLPRESDVIIDIGAGIGEFALWCAEAGATVLTFEPDPLARACLKANTATLVHVGVMPYALWKERDNLRLHCSRDTRESSLIADERPHVRLADVEAWPLDDVPAASGLPVIDLMKVDGEGVEPEILTGALRTLRRTRIAAVDVGASDRRRNLAARVVATLEDLGFRVLSAEGSPAVLALNVAMVGPVSSRVSDRQGW